MSNLAEKKEPTVFEKAAPRFKEIAPTNMVFEAECRFMQQLMAGSRDLPMCTPKSLYGALVNVAALGLTLNPAEKYAYLISRNFKLPDETWEKRAYLEPSYMGLLKLATDSGIVEWVQAYIVYEQDEFIDNGAGLRPTHTYNAFSKDRGKFVGSYCVAKLQSGDFLTTIMPEDEVMSIRARNESVKKGKKSTWDSDFNEMAKKAVIRRAFKTWPRSDGTRFAEAVQISNDNEGFEPITTAPDIAGYTSDQKAYFDQLIEQSDAIGMYLFSLSFDLTDASGPGASAWISLYHSFERGTKGKYQQLVTELTGKGRSLIEGYAASIAACVDSQDVDGMRELIDELTSDALEKACELTTELHGTPYTEINELMGHADNGSNTAE